MFNKNLFNMAGTFHTTFPFQLSSALVSSLKKAFEIKSFEKF